MNTKKKNEPKLVRNWLEGRIGMLGLEDNNSLEPPRPNEKILKLVLRDKEKIRNSLKLRRHLL